MHRRYNRRWSKFDQPDPSDGSYNLADPQSLNRYSYVQNDPVNFVDPSGLNPVSPGTTFSSGILWTVLYGNNADGFRMVHQWFEPYPGSGGEGDGTQNTGQEGNANACSHMADIAKQIADLESEAKNPLVAFDKTFTTHFAGRPASSLFNAGRQWLNRGAGIRAERWEQGETGFRPEFRDTGTHGPGEFVDQTHHFAFYLSMGINENGSGALWAAQRAHRARDNQGDANLGRAAYDMGRMLKRDPSLLRVIDQIIIVSICE